MNANYRPSPWMKYTLVAAGVYNLAWGFAAVVFPTTMLDSLGVEYGIVATKFWQCIGMIVGVYGIGYLIASRAPYRHWPMTLVGLLGKVFGPIGFAAAIANGTLPASMGWTILVNDLIWWMPFVVIRWGAVR